MKPLGEHAREDRLLGLLDRYYPRLIANLDRDPQSPTYGSMDRGRWMYRLHDFDSGVMQQSALVLAVLSHLAKAGRLPAGFRHITSEKADVWHEWALGSMRRTVRLLRRGYLDEYYPGEMSYPATVFAAYAMLKGSLLLGEASLVSGEVLKRTAQELLRRSAGLAANQDIAAAAFLALYRKEVGCSTIEDAHIEALLDGRERPFDAAEYGGLDLGYATVSLNYLAAMHLDDSYPVEARLRRLASRLRRYVTPRGQLGGEYGSRSTAYFLPYGCIAAARLDGEEFADLLRLDIEGSLERLDDRYLLHYCLPSVALSALTLAERGHAEETPSGGRAQERWYDESEGIAGYRDSDASVFVSTLKGGLTHVETASSLHQDLGYRLVRRGRVYSTSLVGIDGNSWSVLDESGDTIRIAGSAGFGRHPLLVSSPAKTIILRLLSPFGPLLNRIFKRLLILSPKPLKEVRLSREVVVQGAQRVVSVSDTIEGLADGDVVLRSVPISPRLVPSSRFPQLNEEMNWPMGAPLEAVGGAIRLRSEIPF